MKKMERIRAALLTLKADAPDLWAEAIENGVCPHNAGMHSAHLYDCGYNETEKAFVLGFCADCWRKALEVKDK